MRSVLAMLFLLLPVLPALADGLQPGARFSCMLKGVSFTGTITGVYPDQEMLLIIDRFGEIVRVPLTELESIRALGKRPRFIMPWESPDVETVPQFEFLTVDGSRIAGVAEPETFFDVKIGTSGVARKVGLEELQLIEAQ
jgi:hypothetical protein